MHAHTEQLLSLRDGEPIEAQVARHVADCPSCQLELDRLRQLQGQLRSLPVRQAPAAAWKNIQASVEQQSEGAAQWRLAPVAAAAGLVALVSLLALRFVGGGQPQETSRAKLHEEPAPTVVEIPPLSAATVEQLVEQSRQLEYVLRNLPEPPRVERVALAATTEIIEQRIQWLDFQLSFEPEAQLSQEQTRRLWHERVDLMDSLVKVRYAQAQSLAF
jgi:hypothetical protein